jgi:TRAP-type uncharacterized transport system substrate-binding protein
MTTARYFVKKIVDPLVEWKGVIFYSSLPIVVTWIVYFFIAETYPDLAFYNYFKFAKTKYRFYSGSQSGSYFLIGEYLSQNSRLENYKIQITNQETEAGYQNVLKVLSDVNSFGIVQGDVIRRNDIIRDEINYVSPLYLEKMHVVYRLNSARRYIKNPELITLSTTTSKDVLRFFANARINVGPSGGGSCILASYILSEINEQAKHDSISLYNQSIIYNDVKSTFMQMKDTAKNSIDIAIYMGGAPNPDIRAMCEKGYRIAQIDLSLITNLNYEYNLNLRFTNLVGKYPYSDVLTFGSYAYLITQKNTPSKDIVDVLDNLISIGNHRKIDNDENPNIAPIREKIEKQIEDYSFFTTYKNAKDIYLRNQMMNMLLFFAITAMGIVASIFAFKKSLSNKCKNQFFSRINDITHVKIPDNIIPMTTMDIQGYQNKDRQSKDQVNAVIDINDPKNNDTKFKTPFIQDNQIPIINKILMGISEIFQLRNDISESYHNNRLTNSDYLFLLQRSDQIVDKLRKSLGIRLFSVLVDKKHVEVFDLKLIHKYFTADYLHRDDYEKLIDLINKN